MKVKTLLWLILVLPALAFGQAYTGNGNAYVPGISSGNGNFGTLGYCFIGNGPTVLPTWQICGSGGTGVSSISGSSGVTVTPTSGAAVATLSPIAGGNTGADLCVPPGVTQSPARCTGLPAGLTIASGRPVSVGALGDSTTVRNQPALDFYNGGSLPTPTTITAVYAITNHTFTSESYMLYGASRSKLAWFPFEFSCGFSGGTSSQILSSILPACLANPYGLPKMMVVMAGINDPGASITTATSLSNLKAIYSTLIASGIQPVAATIFPTNTSGNTAAFEKLNQGIVKLAAEMGIPCADFYSALVNPANGQWNGTAPTSAGEWTIDGTHQSVQGAEIAGYVLNLTITNYLASVGALHTFQYDDSTITTQSRNPAFLTFTGTHNATSSYPSTGWNAASPTADSTIYLPTDTEPGSIHSMWAQTPAILGVSATPNYLGNSWALAGDGTNLVFTNSTSTNYVTYTAGDVVAFMFRARTVVATSPAGGHFLDLGIDLENTSGGAAFCGIEGGSPVGYANQGIQFGGETNYPVGDFYFECKMPAGLAAARMGVILYSNGTNPSNTGDSLIMSNMLWVNLTAAGIVAP